MGNIDIDSLFERQTKVSPEIRNAFLNLEKVITEEVNCGKFIIKIQHNPARIRSTNADIHKETIESRKCFLCHENLKQGQISELWGSKYYITVNPYPIFNRHFTVIAKEHTPQTIMGRISDLLSLNEEYSRYTVFYNGPFSGASAPDHMHFQLIPAGLLPIEKDASDPAIRTATSLKNTFLLKSYFRNAVILEEEDRDILEKRCYHAIEGLACREGESEPRLNIICWKKGSIRYVALLPRSEHRPKEFFLDDPEKIMFSPGAVDMGGIIIAPRYKDFIKYRSPEILEKLFRQVSSNHLPCSL